MKPPQSLVLLASILAAGCVAPVSSGGSDEPASLLDPRIHAEVGIPGGGGSPLSVAATTLLSETGSASDTYPTTSATTFPAGRAEIRLWVYLQNESAGIHIAWGIVKNSSGAVVATIPMAFSSTKAGVGTTHVAGWPSDLKVSLVHPADGGATEFQGAILRSAYSNGTRGEPGPYTVSIFMDDFGVPTGVGTPVGEESFTITGG